MQYKRNTNFINSFLNPIDMEEEKLILDNWNLLSRQTRLMLEAVGISPFQNGKKTCKL